MNSALLRCRGISLERLAAFCDVVSARGLGQASRDRSRVAQLSRQMKELEAYFGVELFERTHRGMIPTALGEELYHIVRNDLRQLEDFRARCAGQPAIIRVTAGNSFIQWRIGPRLGALRERLPQVQWELQARRYYERVPAVRNHECDFAIVRRELISKDLESTPLMTIEHLLFVRRDLLKRAGNGQDAKRLLAKLPLALPPEGDFRLALNQAAIKHELRLNVALHVTSFTMAACAAQTGSYAAILPHIARPEFPDEEFVILSLPLMEGYVQHLALCSNPRFTRVNMAAEEALKELHGLWCGN